MDFFQTAGQNLTEAEKAAGVKLHVALSVVGTEHLQDSGYFRAKLAQETLIKSAPIRRRSNVSEVGEDRYGTRKHDHR
jgi:uncharacterized protein YbjT (DUF2867 family)